ncbi:TraX family protein [Weissella bombi]|uniref:Exosortase/archaeosortase family protein n=1 Tax=Weissella bombi TaxID=1505725 RepID=A0A1C4AXC6_9LACO|nr:TraX family protein [Weissella bombi]SCB99231.1 exosortase/archaeosortase family protein [Weissella bombi]
MTQIKKSGLSGFALKIIGIIFMVVDHINIYLGDVLNLPLWVSLLGRFVAPLFMFFIIEGFYYTHSRKKYFWRLFIGGILMYGINIVRNVVTFNTLNPYTKQFDVFYLLQGQNIFMTLALVLLWIWILDTMFVKRLNFSKYFMLIMALIVITPFIIISEGGPYELVMGLIFYLFRGNFKRISIGVTVFSLLLFAHALMSYFGQVEVGTLYQTLTFDDEYMMITVLPFIYLYNGQRGGNGQKWQKNLFYYFYPIHLIIIYFLSAIF